MEIIEQYVSRTSHTIAAQVSYFRRFRGMTQAQLADACGMKQAAVARLERTPDVQWSSQTLWRIAAALDVRVAADITANPDALGQQTTKGST